jgi:hypothetical protein
MQNTSDNIKQYIELAYNLTYLYDHSEEFSPECECYLLNKMDKLWYSFSTCEIETVNKLIKELGIVKINHKNQIQGTAIK